MIRRRKSQPRQSNHRQVDETNPMGDPGLKDVDGHSPGDIPPGLDAMLADFGDRGGRPTEASLKYLHVSVDDPNRMWAETYFKDQREFARMQRMAIDNMMDTGFVSHEGNMLVSVAGALSVDGYARRQALQVDIAQKAVAQNMAAQLQRASNPDRNNRGMG